MDEKIELKKDLASIQGTIETQDGIYIPLSEVERLLMNRITQIYRIAFSDVRYRFDIPDAESSFAYYDDTAYFDGNVFWMYDQDGNKKRPNEKYLVRK